MDSRQKKRLIEDTLPQLPANDRERLAVEYITMIYEGSDKHTAFKTVFPTRYNRIYNRAKETGHDPRRAVGLDIARFEGGVFVQKLYKLSREHYWTHFIDKRTKLLNNLADEATDQTLDIKDRHSAAKIFLTHVPEVAKEEKVVHEHKIVEDTKFMEQLQARKLALRSAAEKDVIDVELEPQDD